ncbi:MAG: hypothetical protein ACD_2C00052G0001 [uncultured bacterium (gcode 4)]|uniref:HIT domain-containing protein n=1 Tax=uncultured bacterium (gcode 4) TaxID=1234023 RepID=K2H2E6_9BACT|nr:MAG: hypothetical protein ACD_2C00052G0001 [uncultured bacterium (gcode 4)]
MALYDSTTEKWDCLFCEIANWSIATPGIFWENEEFMAFLTIFPSVLWHTVIIPKSHYWSDVLSLPDDVLQRFILAAKEVSNILLSHFEDVGRVWLIMEWTWVDHAHIKLTPMHGTWHMKKWIWRQYLSNRSDWSDKYEWYIISTDWPRADDEVIKRLSEELRKINY